MGHVLFLFLHCIALLFFWLGLLVTIPLHLIYAAASGRKPVPMTHVTCPYCQEFCHKEASICPHCRNALVPARQQREMARAARAASGKQWWQPL